MFTIDQIKAAHAKVKSGADFPNYIRDLKNLGIGSYTVSVADGRTEYSGKTDEKLYSEAKYDALAIADKCEPELFIAQLKAHQQGKTNYMQFCEDCARYGIDKWIVDLQKMTCTYFNKLSSEILTEEIPSV